MPVANRTGGHEYPLPKNVTIVPCYTVAKPDNPVVQYEFRPNGEECEIRFRNGRHCDIYTIPVADARALWARLREQGYERF